MVKIAVWVLSGIVSFHWYDRFVKNSIFDRLNQSAF